jgi:hypothetical protein
MSLMAFNIALAQPLLDLLGRNAEFFVAHRATAWEIVAVGLLFTMVIPTVLACMVIGLTRLSSAAGAWALFVIGTAVLGAFAAQVLKRVPWIGELPGPIVIVAALLVGVGVIGLYLRKGPPRWLIRVGWVVAPLVLILFVFTTPASELVFDSSPLASGGQTIGAPAPLVMVVFDEFPVTSLMDLGGGIDRRMFPNFAELADSSTWYRNTASSQALTERAVPSLLASEEKPPGLPIAADHPHSIFTMLGATYDQTAVEPVTAICPAGLCREPRAEVASTSRWTGILSDVRVVLAHILLPEDLAASLPPLNQGWAGFNDASPGEGDLAEESPGGPEDPRRDFESFLDAIREQDQIDSRDFFFMHSLLPHVPWRYLPSGDEYPKIVIPGRSTTHPTRWTRDDWLVLQGYQRHLLQAQYADRLLGELVRTLRAKGVLDEALMVVVADHGIAFRPGLMQRSAVEETAGQIAFVPLFIKEPGQAKASVSDSPVQTIDVLPTIADVLQIDIPLGMFDGSSVLEPTDRKVRRLFSGGEVYEPAAETNQQDVIRKFRLFGADDGRLDPYAIAPAGLDGLLFQDLEALNVVDPAGVDVRVDRLRQYRKGPDEVDPFPWLLWAELDPDAGLAARKSHIAIAVGGRIAAVTRTFGQNSGKAFLYAMLPPSSFGGSSSKIELFLVEGSGDSTALHELTAR